MVTPVFTSPLAISLRFTQIKVSSLQLLHAMEQHLIVINSPSWKTHSYSQKVEVVKSSNKSLPCSLIELDQFTQNGAHSKNGSNQRWTILTYLLCQKPTKKRTICIMDESNINPTTRTHKSNVGKTLERRKMYCTLHQPTVEYKI